MYYYAADIFTVVGGRNESTVFLERISPEVIFFRPPEKLVIEVKTRGRVLFVQWTINGNSFDGAVGANFAYHREIYVREETTQADIGVYEVRVFPDPFTGQVLLPTELEFLVTSPGNFMLIVMSVISIFYYICIHLL